MNFPYISQIIVHNCYTHQGINIPSVKLQSMKHIILTGMNGSGKTTILNRVAFLLNAIEAKKTRTQLIRHNESLIKSNPGHAHMQQWKQELEMLNDVELLHIEDPNSFTKMNDCIISFFKAHRKIDLKNVTTVTKETDFINTLTKKTTSDNFISLFKQYLVNKKVYEAFDFINAKHTTQNQNKSFFDNLTVILRNIFKDEYLELEFSQENFEFYLRLKDNRRVTFNQLSEGFSAFLSILMDLLMRTDLLRKRLGDYNHSPSGIVLIDEPETHFHLSMQYEILPLINSLFPNIQLVVATHSPAIISSLPDAIIFDLSSKQEVSDWVLGSSYSELMIKHFGLDNEYSGIADEILKNVNKAIKDKNQNALKEILSENEKFLTPSLRLEIESQIIKLSR